MNRLAIPLVLGSMLNPVNSSMLAVALIPIGVAFGASPATTVWLVSSLYVTTAIGQPVVGQLVDRFGARPLYLAGAALVGVAGVLGTVAPSLGWLILIRVLIGLGTSAAYPAAMRLLRDHQDGDHHHDGDHHDGDNHDGDHHDGDNRHGDNRGMLTALAVAGQVIAVVGPSLGGLLVGVAGWQAIFGVNVPFSLVCLVTGARRLPRTEPDTTARIDYVGMAVFAATMITALLFLMEPRHWYLAVAAVVAAGAFVVWELRVDTPFLDLRVLGGNRPLLATYLRQVLAYTVAYSFSFGFVQWLEEGRGLSAQVTGLVILPMSAVAIIAATIAGRKPAIRGTLLIGGVVLIAACAALTVVESGTAVWLLVLVGVVTGVPQGLNGLANQNALYRQADPERMGTAAGLLRTFMYLGAMLSSAAVAATFPHGALTGGLHQLATFMLACAVLLLAVTLVDRSLRAEG